MVARLVDRHPVVEVAALVGGLAPPPLFARVSFASYRPDPDEPTQAQALVAVTSFAEQLAAPPTRRRLGRSAPQPARGIYLDGGFGVGKTHLLASLWHAVAPPRAYATFVELTHLAGALGFAGVVDALSPMRLLAIDEFELDDPGDTVLISSLLARLTEHGVALAATSNTLPDRLGEDRFAADDFLREIQGLAARFTAVRIDGPDFRHRGLPEAPAAPSAAQVTARVTATPGATLDHFDELVTHLATLHPSRYGALVDALPLVGIVGAHTVRDQNVALRIVVLADRLYDRQIPLVLAGVRLSELFDVDMLAGGYRKKYRRAISRLVALARLSEPL